MLDSDLAALYGVSTARLNQQVRRNIERFPPDFMFTLNIKYWARRPQEIAARVHGAGRRDAIERPQQQAVHPEETEETDRVSALIVISTH